MFASAPRSSSIEHREAGALIRFGEHHVETHGASTVLLEELVHDFRHQVAPPGPATEFGERPVIDVDDDDTLVGGQRCEQARLDVVKDGVGLTDEAQLGQAGHVRKQQQQDNCRKRIGHALLGAVTDAKELHGDRRPTTARRPGGGRAPRPPITT